MVSSPPHYDTVSNTQIRSSQVTLPWPPREGPPCLCVSEWPGARQPRHSTMAGDYEAQGASVTSAPHGQPFSKCRTATPGSSGGFIAALSTASVSSTPILGKNDAPHSVPLRWFGLALCKYGNTLCLPKFLGLRGFPNLVPVQRTRLSWHTG